jgi:hypothetical protein
MCLVGGVKDGCSLSLDGFGSAGACQMLCVSGVA